MPEAGMLGYDCEPGRRRMTLAIPPGFRSPLGFSNSAQTWIVSRLVTLLSMNLIFPAPLYSELSARRIFSSVLFLSSSALSKRETKSVSEIEKRT